MSPESFSLAQNSFLENRPHTLPLSTKQFQVLLLLLSGEHKKYTVTQKIMDNPHDLYQSMFCPTNLQVQSPSIAKLSKNFRFHLINIFLFNDKSF